MSLIDHILGIPNSDGDEFKNIQEVVAKFVLDVFGQVPQDSAAPGALVATAASSIVQYDTSGSAIDVAKQQKDTEDELAQALPAVAAAMKALDSLNKKDLGEAKTMAKTPAGVEEVFSAVACLLAG